MPQLKPAFIKQIQDALDEEFFTSSDFEILLSETGKQLVQINFVHNLGYSLQCSEVEKNENYAIEQIAFQTIKETRKYTVYEVTRKPGKYKSVQVTELSDLGELITLIPAWAEAIHDDLIVLAPKKDDLEELAAKFTKDIEDNITDPDEYFSEHEQKAIHTKLNAMMAKLETLEQAQSLTKKQLKQIEKEFEEFKSKTSYYSKGMWAKTTSNKIVKTLKDWANTPEGRQLAIEQLKNFLS